MLLTIAYQSSIIPKKLANRHYVVHNICVRTIFKHKVPNYKEKKLHVHTFL